MILSLTLMSMSVTSAQAGCEDPLSQLEMNHCAAKGFKATDQKLNDLYSNGISGLEKKHQAALIKAQRAWIGYRDLACLSYGLVAEGGSMQSMLVNNCLAEVTNQRIKLLKEQFRTN